MAMKINTEECLNYDFEVTINDGVTLVEFTDSHRHNLSVGAVHGRGRRPG